MSGIQPDLTGQTDILDELIDLIEEIRYRRQDEWRGGQHPNGQRFTQLELTREALPTYGNLLAGRSKRVPARQQLLKVAVYLECSIAETNEILRCARYLPKHQELDDAGYKKLVLRGKWLANSLTLPWLIITPSLEVVTADESSLALNNLPPLSQLDAHEKLGINWYFDPKMPTFPLYNSSTNSTQSNARGLAELLWIAGHPFIHEHWFKQHLGTYTSVSVFETEWERVRQRGVPDDQLEYGEARMQTRFLDQPIHESSSLFPLNRNGDLILMVSVPKDEATRTVYREVGCRIDDVRLNDMLSDMRITS